MTETNETVNTTDGNGKAKSGKGNTPGYMRVFSGLKRVTEALNAFREYAARYEGVGEANRAFIQLGYAVDGAEEALSEWTFIAESGLKPTKKPAKKGNGSGVERKGAGFAKDARVEVRDKYKENYGASGNKVFAVADSAGAIVWCVDSTGERFGLPKAHLKLAGTADPTRVRKQPAATAATA